MRSRFIAAALAILAWSSSALADDRFGAPSYFTIRSISHAGSGCPAGTVAENISPDLQAFTLLFDSYVAEFGPGVPFTAKRKNCQLLFDFDYPAGWQFALLTLDTRGYASLESGVRAVQQTRFYFQGQTQTGSLTTNLVGPIDQDYQVRDVLPATQLTFSPCGAQRALNVNTSVQLSGASNRSGLITVDSIDGYVTHYYAIQWRRC